MPFLMLFGIGCDRCCLDFDQLSDVGNRMLMLCMQSEENANCFILSAV